LLLSIWNPSYLPCCCHLGFSRPPNPPHSWFYSHFVVQFSQAALSSSVQIHLLSAYQRILIVPGSLCPSSPISGRYRFIFMPVFFIIFQGWLLMSNCGICSSHHFSTILYSLQDVILI
jgi:hypothetical protein